MDQKDTDRDYASAGLALVYDLDYALAPIVAEAHALDDKRTAPLIEGMLMHRANRLESMMPTRSAVLRDLSGRADALCTIANYLRGADARASEEYGVVAPANGMNRPARRRQTQRLLDIAVATCRVHEEYLEPAPLDRASLDTGAKILIDSIAYGALEGWGRSGMTPGEAREAFREDCQRTVEIVQAQDEPNPGETAFYKAIGEDPMSIEAAATVVVAAHWYPGSFVSAEKLSVQRLDHRLTALAAQTLSPSTDCVLGGHKPDEGADLSPG